MTNSRDTTRTFRSHGIPQSIAGGMIICVLLAPAARAQDDAAQPSQKTISFYRDVRPILQRHCSGCHFAGKKGGNLVLTSFADFRKGGEAGESFTPGKPDESLILDYISGEDPEMPLNQPALDPPQVALIKNWIAQGAKDDTPPGVADTISQEHPPEYSSPPVITALDYSPDNKLLAVSGYREILLHDANGGGLKARLVGRSQRIESVCFSPDGKLLAGVGGNPALFGEVQIWDVASRKLLHSISVSHDTLFGASFSEDNKLLGFGGADNTARVVRVDDGKQQMRLDTHSDWVLSTAFSLKNDHLISVSRDRSVKLTIVESGQFVDNVTSITPGALKGGLQAVARHPKKEQVLTAGADGVPRLYKIFRTRKRVIGDDFNHIRSYSALPGRIFSLEFSADGSMFVAGSSTATSGAVAIYKTGEYVEKDINNGGGLGEVRNQIAKRSAEKTQLHELKGIKGPVFATAFRPDGKQVAVGGFDGSVRLFDVKTGKPVREFVPVPVKENVAAR